MADGAKSDEGDAARLEAALARIARAKPATPTTDLKTRLDALIAELRAALDH